jgi:hypothetical protein
MRSLLIVCLLCALAHAAPTQEVAELTVAAQAQARQHDCESIPDLATRVRRLDPTYYEAVFARDPEIANCELSISTIDRGDNGPPVYKDRTTAIALSVIPTVAGAGIMAAGFALMRNDDGVGGIVAAIGSLTLFVGPSFGHAYAGQTWTPWLGVKIASSVVATVVSVATIAADHDDGLELQPRTEKILIATALVCGTGYLVGLVGDLATAGSAADDYNRKHFQLTVTPVATQTGITPGVGLAGRF